jgi:hypothetical protein
MFLYVSVELLTRFEALLMGLARGFTQQIKFISCEEGAVNRCHVCDKDGIGGGGRRGIQTRDAVSLRSRLRP